MATAIVGHTGFVGGNYAAQFAFDDSYNSKTIESIAGRSYEFLVVSAMPAAMWVANKDPDGDRAVLDRLTGCLSLVTARKVVLISTVAVYPTPLGVDESTPIDRSAQTPYGRHRLMLEDFATGHFPDVTVVRLPGLFGPGLKKNVVYDLLHGNQLQNVHADAVYQFYDLRRIAADVRACLDRGLALVNFGTEPVSVREVARGAFDRDFTHDPGTPPARYDMRTVHAAALGGRGAYLADKASVLAGLRSFVAAERAAGGAP